MHRITATFRHPETGAEFTAHFGGEWGDIKPVFLRFEAGLSDDGWLLRDARTDTGFETTGETAS